MVGAMADLIGTTEAAKRKGVDRTTFFRWVQLGHIKPVMKMSGKTGAMLFDPTEVDALDLPAPAAEAAS